MNDEIVTSDLADFGYVELRMAAALLNAYCDNPSLLSGDDVRIYLNRNSGYVFLSDENHDVAMMNGDKLERWYTCPECSWEGFADYYEYDTKHGNTKPCCKAYMIEIGAIEANESD